MLCPLFYYWLVVEQSAEVKKTEVLMENFRRSTGKAPSPPGQPWLKFTQAQQAGRLDLTGWQVDRLTVNFAI